MLKRSRVILGLAAAALASLFLFVASSPEVSARAYLLSTQKLSARNVYSCTPLSTADVYLTAGSSWVAPACWNSVEVWALGGGSGGTTTTYGAGGSSGQFAKAASIAIMPGSSYTYGIGAGGAANTSGGNTWFNAASFAACVSNTVCVSAQGGQVGSGQSAGAGGSTGVGTTLTNGCAGAPGNTASYGGGGGCGAPGPNGASTSPTNALGSRGDNSTGGIGGGTTNPAANGAAGTEWGDGIQGSGGGGAAGVNATGSGKYGANGGAYGAGGGGSGNGGAGGGGAQGLIRLKRLGAIVPANDNHSAIARITA